jgi:hypothetical protein
VSRAPKRIAEAVDRLCLSGLAGSAGRGRDLLRLYRAARRRAGESLCMAAARSLAAAAVPGATVLLLTGAGGPPRLPHGETDGPLGVAVLARALVLACGIRPVIVGERRLREPIVATLDALAGRHGAAWRWSVRFLAFPLRRDAAARAADEIYGREEPVAMIAVERLGPNSRGVIHNAAGRDVTRVHGGVEALFGVARKRGVPTIGVGDRGNEVGFGSLVTGNRKGAACSCPCGTTIECAVPADVVVVAAVSNWGAHAIAAALAVLLRDGRLLHRPSDERRMLAACVGAGARDGLSAAQRMTVDGLPVRSHMHLVTKLRELAVGLIGRDRHE